MVAQPWNYFFKPDDFTWGCAAANETPNAKSASFFGNPNLLGEGGKGGNLRVLDVVRMEALGWKR